jgi:ABC-type sulfate transport system substrate-binding protein
MKKSRYSVVISPKISGVQKWNFLGIISEEILNEEVTTPLAPPA